MSRKYNLQPDVGEFQTIELEHVLEDSEIEQLLKKEMVNPIGAYIAFGMYTEAKFGSDKNDWTPNEAVAKMGFVGYIESLGYQIDIWPVLVFEEMQ